MKKLVVIFPGAGYGIDCPLLYYADFLFETNGYERVHMNYQEILLNKNITLDEKIQQLREYERKQISSMDFTIYDKVVFLSKSVGTVEAGWLAKELGIEAQQIFLTPIKETLPYCYDDCRVVIGTEDAAYMVYKDYCDKMQMKALYIEGANHSLEVIGKPYESIETLKMVMEFIEG